jgi:exodeoxyribonuclease VII large subunit
MKVTPIVYGDRKVYPVAAFNEGIARYLRRLPALWVEGEVTELKRNPAWANVFFTLKDTTTGACLPVTIGRSRFDGLDLGLGEGERVHVEGRAQLFAARGELSFRAHTIERFGLGEHLAALERLKQKLAAEGLFAAGRKRSLPPFPTAVGLLTGTDAAARGDLVTAITTRFPPAHIVVCETRVQGHRAAASIADGLRRLAAHAAVDVVILSRGGGSFEDLLPFSDEAVVRAVADCEVPVVSAVGHEQDTPLCDLAADVRASTPTAAARLVVPDLDGLLTGLDQSRTRLGRAARGLLQRHRERALRLGERLQAAPLRLLERRRAALQTLEGRLLALSPAATLARGYAVVRAGGAIVREAATVSPGEAIEVELASGSLGARVEEVRAPEGRA